MLWSRVLLSVIAAVAVPQALAYRATDRNAEDKISDSEVVAIGRVESVIAQGSDLHLVVSPALVLKGAIGNELEVRVSGSIPELRPQCCEVGGLYIFYLNADPAEPFYRPLPGAFGVVLIEDGRSGHP